MSEAVNQWRNEMYGWKWNDRENEKWNIERKCQLNNKCSCVRKWRYLWKYENKIYNENMKAVYMKININDNGNSMIHINMKMSVK